MRAAGTQGRHIGLFAASAVITLVALLGIQFATSSGVFAQKGVTVTLSETSSLTVTVTSSAVTSSSSASQSSLVSCLLPVEPSANVTDSGQGMDIGALVTYESGEQVFYPQDLCPQPVSNKTYEYGANFPGTTTWVPTSNYQLALAAVTNPQFVALENGTTYLYSQPETLPWSSADDNQLQSDAQGYEFPLYFYHYSDVGRPCFNGFDGLTPTSGIQVIFSASYTQVGAVDNHPTSDWNLTDPSISMMPTADVQQEAVCVAA
jgi:hypothetical protein